MMRCYLIRHAQTDWNQENRIQGHADLPLSAVGREQAKRLETYFARRPLGVLYTSHLARSLQTAQAIAHATGLTPTIESALAEIHLGEWEGLTPEEVNARYQGGYQHWRVRSSQVTIPGAEPIDVFRERVRTAIRTIFAAHHDADVAIVSHGGVIAALLADWLGADYDHVLHRLVLDNAGISALDCQSQPPAILWINETRHLRSTDGA